MNNTHDGEERNKLQLFLEKKSVQWLVICAVFLLAVAIIFVSNDNFYHDFGAYFTFPAVKHRSSDTMVRVTIDFGSGKKRAFEGSVTTPLVAAEALRAAASAGNFPVKIALSGDITEINKIKVDGKKQWRWYLNNRPQVKTILDITVSGGDNILIKYE